MWSHSGVAKATRSPAMTHPHLVQPSAPGPRPVAGPPVLWVPLTCAPQSSLGARAPGSQSRLPEPSPELCVCALWRHLSRHLLGFTCPELRRLLSFNCVVLFTKCFPPGGKHPTGPSSPRGSWGLPATSPAPRMWRGCRPSQASSLPPSLHQRGPAFVPSETILIPRTLP